MKKAVNLLIGIILLMTAFAVNAYATDVEEAPTMPPEVEIYWDGGVEIVPPDKTTYIEGEMLDLTGLEVYGTSGEIYTDGTSKVTYRKPIQYYTIDLENVLLTVDNTTVTVTGIHPLMQTTVSDTFEITVLPASTATPTPTPDVTITENLITGTVTLPDGITAPEGGMKVNIYAGFIRLSGGGGYWFSDKYLGYNGIETYIPSDTINRNKSRMSIQSQTTITIPEGESSINFSLVSSGKISSQGLVCIIDNDTYIGEDCKWRLGSIVSNVAMTLSCYKKATVSGKITIPKSDTDTNITVVAEGNVGVEENIEEKSYSKYNEFAAIQKLTIPAEETSIEYSLSLKENMEYTVYVVFGDKKYKRPVQTINVTSGNYTADFNSFEESNKFSTTIKLPEGITEFQFCDGEVSEAVVGTAYLQSASAPYYRLDECSFVIESGNTSAFVELYDDIGVDDVFISYNLDSSLKNIYYGGVYYDNTKCVPNIEYASKIKSENRNVTLNIIKATTVHIQVENNANTYFYLNAIVQRDKNDLKDAENCELMIEVIDHGIDMSDACVTIPEDYNYFTLLAKFDKTYETAYLTEDEYARNIENAKIFSVTDTELKIAWNGYDPIYAFSDYISCYPEENEDFYDCKMTIINQSDFAKENARMYAILFDADGQFIGAFVNEPFSIKSKEDQEHTISIPTEDYNNAEEIYIMFWDDVKPLSEKFKVYKND